MTTITAPVNPTLKRYLAVATAIVVAGIVALVVALTTGSDSQAGTGSTTFNGTGASLTDNSCHAMLHAYC